MHSITSIFNATTIFFPPAKLAGAISGLCLMTLIAKRAICKQPLLRNNEFDFAAYGVCVIIGGISAALLGISAVQGVLLGAVVCTIIHVAGKLFYRSPKFLVEKGVYFAALNDLKQAKEAIQQAIDVATSQKGVTRAQSFIMILSAVNSFPSLFLTYYFEVLKKFSESITHISHESPQEANVIWNDFFKEAYKCCDKESKLYNIEIDESINDKIISCTGHLIKSLVDCAWSQLEDGDVTIFDVMLEHIKQSQQGEYEAILIIISGALDLFISKQVEGGKEIVLNEKIFWKIIKAKNQLDFDYFAPKMTTLSDEYLLNKDQEAESSRYLILNSIAKTAGKLAYAQIKQGQEVNIFENIFREMELVHSDIEIAELLFVACKAISKQDAADWDDYNHKNICNILLFNISRSSLCLISSIILKKVYSFIFDKLSFQDNPKKISQFCDEMMIKRSVKIASRLMEKDKFSEGKESILSPIIISGADFILNQVSFDETLSLFDWSKHIKNNVDRLEFISQFYIIKKIANEEQSLKFVLLKQQIDEKCSALLEQIQQEDYESKDYQVIKRLVSLLDTFAKNYSSISYLCLHTILEKLFLSVDAFMDPSQKCKLLQTLAQANIKIKFEDENLERAALDKKIFISLTEAKNQNLLSKLLSDEWEEFDWNEPFDSIINMEKSRTRIKNRLEGKKTTSKIMPEDHEFPLPKYGPVVLNCDIFRAYITAANKKNESFEKVKYVNGIVNLIKRYIKGSSQLEFVFDSDLLKNLILILNQMDEDSKKYVSLQRVIQLMVEIIENPNVLTSCFDREILPLKIYQDCIKFSLQCESNLKAKLLNTLLSILKIEFYLQASPPLDRIDSYFGSLPGDVIRKIFFKSTVSSILALRSVNSHLRYKIDADVQFNRCILYTIVLDMCEGMEVPK